MVMVSSHGVFILVSSALLLLLLLLLLPLPLPLPLLLLLLLLLLCYGLFSIAFVSSFFLSFGFCFF